MPRHANLSEQGRASGQTRADRTHDHEHAAFSPPIPPLDGHPAGRRTPGPAGTAWPRSPPACCWPRAAATAAFANPIPIGDGSSVPITPVAPATVRVISAGGMAGWQVALIAAGAALAAAAPAVSADRKLAGCCGATATTA